ncbi:MAG: hypothetical protein NZ518_08330, partial [Dehalococcoidia bacterium]|nr:hypothetical protein [Dehalococcoidia bacterium]
MTTTALPEGASGATPIRGLTSAEVLERRRQGLGNNARIATSRTYTEIIRENVFTFINNVLCVLGVFLGLLGRTSDAVTSVGVAMLN